MEVDRNNRLVARTADCETAKPHSENEFIFASWQWGKPWLEIIFTRKTIEFLC